MEMLTTCGSKPRRAPPAGAKPRSLAVVELILTMALAVSTLVAVTVVSIGIARADAFGAGDQPSAPLGLGLFIGLFLSAMGGLTALMAERGDEHE
jgi:glycerol uptake facilitator-like aquaporin